jgi:hypothetical protein
MVKGPGTNINRYTTKESGFQGKEKGLSRLPYLDNDWNNPFDVFEP